MIVNEIGALPGQRFAVIVDEAHSSQSGESTRSLKAVLSADGLEEAEVDDRGEEIDLEERKEKGYGFKALVAFSGKVRAGGLEYTETGMNGFPESQTAETFKRDEYRILIVANKFQTGYDMPLLHTMYVDKKLGGVNAVQTLSRLNRMHPGKEEAVALDFANEADEIQKAFEPYYEKTLLTEGTDPNLLYDLQGRLLDFHFYDNTEVDRFAQIWFEPQATQDKLQEMMDSNFKFYKQITDDREFAKFFFNWLFDRYYRQKKQSGK